MAGTLEVEYATSPLHIAVSTIETNAFFLEIKKCEQNKLLVLKFRKSHHIYETEVRKNSENPTTR